MHDEIEEEIRKNLIIYLNNHCCKFCYKPLSNKSIVEIDDLTFIFSEKWFYKLDCSVSNNPTTIKYNYKSIYGKITKKSISLLKPSLHGEVLRFGITCTNCWNIKFLEYNLEKLSGTKNYLNWQ